MTEDPLEALAKAAEELASGYVSATESARNDFAVEVEPLGKVGETDSLWAVDGSHTFLLGAGGRFLAWVRAVAVRYDVGGGGELQLGDIEVRQEPLLFDLQQKTMDGVRAGGNVSDMADYHRHRLELSLLGDIVHKAGMGMVALDGALSAPPSGELSDLLQDAVSSCCKGGVTLVGVSKDSNSRKLGTGICDEDALGARGYAGTGFVRLPELADRRRPPVLGDSYFVRLHISAPKWFRVDITSSQTPAEVLGRLARFSTSGVSPGYPLPLLEAHRTAVLVRQMQPQLRELALKSAARAGMPAAQLAMALTDNDGRRAGEFHALLDEIARVRK